MPQVVKIPGRRKPWRVLFHVEGSTKRKARFFRSRQDAAAFAATLAGRDDAFDELLRLPQADRLRVLACVRSCGGVDGLEQAAAAYAASRARLSKSLADAADECVAAKQAAGRSWQYVENLEVCLRSFRSGRETHAVSEISASEVEKWLHDPLVNAGKPWSAETRLTYLRRLDTFFEWCIRRGYAASNPLASVERPTAGNGRIVVLSVPDVRRLLETCRRVDPLLLPYFAIGLFAGIRPDELKRLRPENVRGGWIEVEAAKAKTRRRRLVEVHPTLRAWLDLGGEIGWTNWRRRWRAVRNGTAVTESGPAVPLSWASDIMRHTFCSYAYPIRGAAWTAEHAGHSEAILFQRYRELVTREAAEQFWAILPRKVE